MTKCLGITPSECADNDGHNTDAIDALTLTVPVIIKYSDAPREERNRKVCLSVLVITLSEFYIFKRFLQTFR